MGKYGEAAVRAVLLLHSGKAACPAEAWEIATSELFGKGTFSQSKGCPRGAFLGLCEAGLVKGVNSNQPMKLSKNKGYAIKAVDLLRQNSELASNKTALWEKVAGAKTHNSQMDVVLSLWFNDLIRPGSSQ